MKIIALGGAGQEGSRTVRDLAASELVESIIIADLNIDAAEQLKQEVGGDKTSVLKLDATDDVYLVKVLKEVDVAVSFVGPYYRFGLPILRAAIEAGCNYVDICDDAEPTLEMLKLHGEAKEKGIVAVIGCGVSPGTLNVLARDAANRLDSVEDLHFRWNVSCTDIEGDISNSAAMEHGLHIMDGDVVQYLDGAWTTVAAMSGSEKIEYPVLGTQEAYYLGHPEPVTIPRYIDGVRNVTQKGGVAGLDGILRQLRELGLTSDEPLHLKSGAMVRPSEVAIALLGRISEPEDSSTLPPPVTEMMLIAKGKLQGRAATLTYTMTGKMGPLTGIPASIVAQMIGTDKVGEKGVFAPEGCLDADVFIAELTKRGIEVVIKEG